MSVQKRRLKAILRRQWVAEMRAKWDQRKAEDGFFDGYFAVLLVIVVISAIFGLVFLR